MVHQNTTQKWILRFFHFAFFFNILIDIASRRQIHRNTKYYFCIFLNFTIFSVSDFRVNLYGGLPIKISLHYMFFLKENCIFNVFKFNRIENIDITRKKHIILGGVRQLMFSMLSGIHWASPASFSVISARSCAKANIKHMVRSTLLLLFISDGPPGWILEFPLFL